MVTMQVCLGNVIQTFRMKRKLVFKLYSTFNSGIIGGSRHMMLVLFSCILLYLDTASLLVPQSVTWQHPMLCFIFIDDNR